MNIDYDKYPLPRRFRHHTNPMLYFPASELKIVPPGYPPIYDKIDWSEHFGNGAPPDALDIGCGKGSFLLEYSDQNPERNILGIEVRKIPADWIRNYIDGEKIGSCSVFWYSVVNGLRFAGDESVRDMFYFFPDPWPKRRHQKRRAFNNLLLEEAARILKKDGRLWLQTDVAEVDEYHKSLLDNHSGFRYEIVGPGDDWKLPVTNKEKFCIRKNIRIYRIIARKK